MICHVTVRTPRLNETVEFYQWLLELPISRKLNTPTGEIVFLGEEETKFEIIQDDRAEKVEAKALTVGFAVKILEDKLAMLDSKNITHSQVLSPQPKTRFAYFTDLNGCVIQLFEGR